MTFQQLNEGLLMDKNPSKSFDVQLKMIDDMSNAINTKEFKDKIKLVQKDNPDLAKALNGYVSLATKAKKIVTKVKSKGMSKDRKESIKQMNALKDFSEELKGGFDLLKKFSNKADKGLKNNEGIGTVIGNTLRNVLTGQWIINLLKNAKSNLMDSEAELKTVQDVFDIKDY